MFNPLGWYNDQGEKAKAAGKLAKPFFKVAAPKLRHTGSKVLNLPYQNFTRLGAKFPKQYQGKTPSCVAYSAALAVDIISATEIVNGDQEIWKGPTSTEYIYSTARLNIGRRKLWRGGCTGAWAVEALNSYGCVPRGQYDRINLEGNDPNRDKWWGNRKFPKFIVDIGSQHTIENYTLCDDLQDILDALANDNPVLLCSELAFRNKRDDEGFSKLIDEKWLHCLCLIGIDTEYRRPGVLVNNSFGPRWITGPKRWDQPNDTFWCDLDDLEQAFKTDNDIWSLASFKGWEK